MRRHVIGWGVVLVVVGLWIWLSALGVPYVDFGRNWPLLLVALGLYIIVRKAVRPARRRRTADSVITDLESGKIDVERAISEIRRPK